MTEDFNSHANANKDIATSAAVGTSPSPPPKIGTFTSLRLPNFRWLLSGSILSYAIQWIQSVILSWLVYNLTGSGTILGTINLVSSVASLVMVFATGILVDNFNRRKLMLLETGGIFAFTLALGFILFTGHSNISFLFIYAFIYGMVQTLDSTLRQVLVFDLVPRQQTPNAMALIQTGWSLMRVLGPSIGGFFLIWFGAGGSFLAQAGGFALIIITIIRMRIPERKPEAVRSSALQNIRDGLGYIFAQPVTRIFTLIGIIMPIIIIPIFVILPPIYAVQVFGDSSGRVLGFLLASVGVGGIIGGVVTAYLRRLEHWGRLQMASLLLLSITLLAFAFSTNLPVALALLALSGFFEIIFLTTNMTLIQLSIPDKLRARVTAATNLVWILSPIGSMLAGAGSDWLGPKTITIILSITGVGVVILIYLVSPTIRNYRLSQGITSNQV